MLFCCCFLFFFLNRNAYDVLTGGFKNIGRGVMDVVGQGWEVMRPAGSRADLAACWRRWVEDALGGKLLPLVLCAVVASLAPLLQAELLSSAFLAPPAPPRGILGTLA